jgi:hypothetical protein
MVTVYRLSSDKNQGLCMSWTDLHKATGHTAFSTLDKAIKNGIYKGIKVDLVTNMRHVND